MQKQAREGAARQYKASRKRTSSVVPGESCGTSSSTAGGEHVPNDVIDNLMNKATS